MLGDTCCCTSCEGVTKWVIYKLWGILLETHYLTQNIKNEKMDVSDIVDGQVKTTDVFLHLPSQNSDLEYLQH